MTEVSGQSESERWPVGHRAALCLVMRLIGPGSSPKAETGLFAAEPYGATGLVSLLDLLADLDLQTTIAADEDAVQAYAPLLRRCHESGHEIAVASASESEQRATVDRTVDALRHITGTDPLGLLISAASEFDATTLSWAEWQLASAATDALTVSARGEGIQPLVTLPGNPYWVDATWLSPERPLPPSSLLEAWTLSIAAVRLSGGLMTAVIHPHLIARPGLRATLGRFLDETIGSGDVWIARAVDVAGWWQERFSQE